MGFKGIIAATASVALMATPTLAAAQTAAPASSEIAPAGENVDGSELRGGFIIPIIALVAIILGIIAATRGQDCGIGNGGQNNGTGNGGVCPHSP